MDRTSFTDLLGSSSVQFAKRHAISAETGSNFHKAYIEPKNVNRYKLPAIRDLIMKALRSNVILCSLEKTQHLQVCEEMWQRNIDPGVSIIKQGWLLLTPSFFR